MKPLRGRRCDDRIVVMEPQKIMQARCLISTSTESFVLMAVAAARSEASTSGCLARNYVRAIMETIDLSVALKKLHQLSLEDGDLGGQYWHSIIRLLRSVAELERENQKLREALDARE